MAICPTFRELLITAIVPPPRTDNEVILTTGDKRSSFCTKVHSVQTNIRQSQLAKSFIYYDSSIISKVR